MRADKQRNRNRILRAAESLIMERGADIPLEEIARAADVGSATMHRHFGDRRKLLEAVFRDRADALADRAVQFAGQGTAAWALDAWLRELCRWLADTRGLARSLAGSPDAENVQDPSCRAVVRLAGQQLLDRARDEGSAPPGVTMDELITLIIGVFLAADAGLLGENDPAGLISLIIGSVALGGRTPPRR
jgi:AcrR family transcriptional regulator